jgi:hypothetical protein
MTEAAMSLLDFTPKEWVLVFRVCSALRVGERPRPYFKDFVALRVAGPAPDLADRVWRLDREG